MKFIVGQEAPSGPCGAGGKLLPKLKAPENPFKSNNVKQGRCEANFKGFGLIRHVIESKATQ